MRLTLRLILLLTLPPLMWSGNAMVGRLMVGQIPPFTLNFVRWVIVAVILLPLAWRALQPWSRVAERWPYLLAIGVLGVGAYNSLQYLALVSSTPVNVTLVASSLSAWMMLIGVVVYREHPTRRQIAGAAMGLIGVVFVVSRGSWEVLTAVRFVPGDLYMLLATIGWAVYSWLLARPPAHMLGAQRPDWDWAGLLMVQVLFGLPASALFFGAEQWSGAAPIQWHIGTVSAVMFAAVGASLVAYRSWGLGVAEGGPALAAFFYNLTPLFAALMSLWILGEVPQVHHLVAFVLIVGGIAVSTSAATASGQNVRTSPGSRRHPAAGSDR